MNSPHFTVLVPVYNDQRFVSEALDSLLAQTCDDWEAVIVDDGSTDGTPSILADYARRDHRFRLVRQDKGGTAVALNAALLKAGGEWICWLSSDDLFDPCKLALHQQWIQAKPACRFFLTHSRELDQTTGLLDEPAFGVEFPPPERQVIQMLRNNYIHGNSVCISRFAWREVGGFDSTFDWAQDYDMWLRLLAAHSATFIPERTCTTRIHPDQETARFAGAGQLDSARAAMRLLANRGLASFVPSLVKGDRSSRREALRLAVAVAADVSAIIYAAGPHPLLLMRIVEWLQTGADLAERDLGCRFLRRACERVNHTVADAEFALMWRAVANVAGTSALSVGIDDANPWRVVERFLIRARASDPQLADYLARYQSLRGRGLPAGDGAACLSPDAGVVALDTRLVESGDILTQAVTGTRTRVPRGSLWSLGDAVVTVSRGNDALEWAGGLLGLRVSTQARLRVLLTAIGAGSSSIEVVDRGVYDSANRKPDTYDLVLLSHARTPFGAVVLLDVSRLWASVGQWTTTQARRTRMVVAKLVATAPQRWPSAVRELRRERERRRHLRSVQRARHVP